MKVQLIALVGGRPMRGEAQSRTRGGIQRALPILLFLLALSFTLTGCVVGRRHRGGGVVVAPPPPIGRHRGGTVVIAPALPPLVVLNVEPYYVHGGYHYHYQNDRWYYSHSKAGPWKDLPRERYPKRVEFRRDGPDRRNDRDNDHDNGRDKGRHKKGPWWRRGKDKGKPSGNRGR